MSSGSRRISGLGTLLLAIAMVIAFIASSQENVESAQAVREHLHVVLPAR